MKDHIISDDYNFARHLSEVATDHYLIHSHDCYELYYIVRGDMTYLYDGTEYSLSPHTLLVIPPGVIHGIHIRSNAPYERYTFHFVPSFFAKERQGMVMQLLPTITTARNRTSPIPFFIENADRFAIRMRLDEILSLGEKDKETEHRFAPILMEALLVSLYLGLSGNRQSIPTFSQPVPRELAEILDYLRRHPSDRITLEKLSTRFYISRSQLNNLFRKYFNTSVMDYVTGQRLSYAQKLLYNGMPAAQVASTIGYTDYSTFYRAYTKHIGHPPTQDKGTQNPGEEERMQNWLNAVPFQDPLEGMRSERAMHQTHLPDIGFENNAYDPLDTY